jgi:hypothetical protein
VLVEPQPCSTSYLQPPQRNNINSTLCDNPRTLHFRRFHEKTAAATSGFYELWTIPKTSFYRLGKRAEGWKKQKPLTPASTAPPEDSCLTRGIKHVDSER